MINGLYLITDHNRDNRLVERVRMALRGGVKIVQYRDKESSGQEQRQLAYELASLCRKAGALFIINDSTELALACDADGVHLGQQDMSLSEARRLLGPGKIVGVSNAAVLPLAFEHAHHRDAIGDIASQLLCCIVGRDLRP